MSSPTNTQHPHYLADDFASIRQRLIDIKSCAPSNKSTAASLRDAIEGGAPWWPEGVITDGADHFVIPR